MGTDPTDLLGQFQFLNLSPWKETVYFNTCVVLRSFLGADGPMPELMSAMR